jgi:hypothetical protein
MEPIKPSLIEVKELKVIKLRMGQKALDMTFSFLYNSQPSKIARVFNFTDNPTGFIIGIISDIKKQLNSKIEKEEEMKEKLVNYMNRLVQQIKDLEKYKEHEKYMKEFNKIDCYKVSFPEIEYNPGRRPSERWA